MSPRERRIVVSDEAIRRALRPGPAVSAPTDLAFSVGRAIADQPQRRWGRGLSGGPWARQLGLAGQLVLVLALLLALIVGVIIAGSLRQRPLGSSPLFVAQSGVLSVIDPETGGATPVLDDPNGIFGVTRSTSGDLVAYWTGTAGRRGTTLELVRADGTDRRALATNLAPAPVGRGGIDVFSADDRYLAAGVSADGSHRILVVDVATGEGHLIGPDDGADNPLWSPDGEWLAFTSEHPGRPSTLAVMRPDGSELREISAALSADVSGPTNWSADGRWVYFDARTTTHDVYRVDARSGLIEPLTKDRTAAAPALSPDDRWVAYLVLARPGSGDVDSVWIMKADGSDPRPLVEEADIRGWSPDGRYVLVAAQPSGGPAQLLAVSPDGAERRVLMTQEACPEPCLQDLSWGWPRP
jgi:dipeptidyl aminopeptidase/acylaminoacyl peptidase